MTQMKTAIISGCGRMGLNHAKALAKNNIKITHICDAKKSAIESFLSHLESIKYPCKPKYLHSINELNKGENIDIAVISTTTDGRYKEAMAALDARIPNILLEKPVSRSLHECSMLEKIASERKLRIAVNHPMRYLQIYQIIKRLLTTSDLGELSTMSVNAGNFGLAMNACHYFEAFRYISNESVVCISADFDEKKVKNPRGEQFSDVSGSICAKTSSGKRLFVNACMKSGHGLHVTYLTKNARVTVDELSGELLITKRVASEMNMPTTRYALASASTHQQIEPFELINSTSRVVIDLLNDGDYPTIQNGKHAIKSLICAYHSDKAGGKFINMNDISDWDETIYPWA